jgi:hypothetical protein
VRFTAAFYGGSDAIQHDIIATQALGLPRGEHR